MPDISGPIFDGRINRALDAATDDIERSVGKRGINLIQRMLNTTLRQQTGRYRSTIKLKGTAGGVQIVGDDIIYGRWLEGTGSRNAPKTIFPGYGTFFKATPILDGQSKSIAEEIVRKKLEALG